MASLKTETDNGVNVDDSSRHFIESTMPTISQESSSKPALAFPSYIHRSSPPTRSQVAVLAGDYLLARASVLLARLGDVQVVEIMATALDSLVQGEIMQLKMDPEKMLDISQYLRKSYYKTASLITNACKSCAILGGHEFDSDVSFLLLTAVVRYWCTRNASRPLRGSVHSRVELLSPPADNGCSVFGVVLAVECN